MKKVKVTLVGAQSVGKTTVLNYFRNTFLSPITEVARNLSKQGVKINEDGDKKSQDVIFQTYYDLLSQDIDYISDRGLIDVIAYTSYLDDTGKINDNHKTLVNQLNKLSEFIKTNPDILVVYFPIEFQLVDDGVRSTNESFRTSIDNRIKELLEYFYSNYITVHGTPEERIKQIIDAIDNRLIDGEPKLKMSNIKENTMYL